MGNMERIELPANYLVRLQRLAEVVGLEPTSTMDLMCDFPLGTWWLGNGLKSVRLWAQDRLMAISPYEALISIEHYYSVARVSGAGG